MARFEIELERLFNRVFNKPYHINTVSATPSQNNELYKIADKYKGKQVPDSSYLVKDGYGAEVWLPVYLSGLPSDVGDNGDLLLPYTVVKISGSNEIIKTPMPEQVGTVKELYSTDDYKITIKGFFIDKERRLYPEKDLLALKKIHELGKSFTLYNKKTDIFLANKNLPVSEQNRVIITKFYLPEVEGGRKEVCPFVMELESDYVFTLIAE